jgi:hypothetical protein
MKMNMRGIFHQRDRRRRGIIVPIKPLTLAACLFVCFVGCAPQAMTSDPFVNDGRGPQYPMNRAGGADQQTAFRREVLRNQLHQSQLDLQQASTSDERRGVQERIEIIQAQLRRLGDAR